MTEYLRIFQTAAGEAATLAAYDEIVRRWPVPCVEMDVPTGGGMTHVIASGPEKSVKDLTGRQVDSRLFLTERLSLAARV